VSPLQFVMFLIAVPALIYAALMIWWVLYDEFLKLRPDVTRQVWMKAEDPRRRLVVVRTDRNGNPSIAVRADQAHKWDDRHEGTE
jgi:hypothetical protein